MASEKTIKTARARFLAPGTLLLHLTVIYFFWWRAKTLTITTERVIFRKGVFGKDERSVRLQRIQDIAIRRSFLGRMLDYGQIRIESAGSGSTEIVFNNVASPTRLRDLIMQMSAQLEQQKSGV